MYKKIPAIIISTLLAFSLLTSCSPELTSKKPPEQPIPSDYSTYTSEGLFSISYPHEWMPAMSLIEETEKTIKDQMKADDPELALDEFHFIFIGGVPYEMGYYPSVNIGIIPRSIGYWDLDEIVDAETQYSKLYTEGYREYARTETVVDGQKAIIIDSEDYDSVENEHWRYLQSYMVKDKFVWIVTVSSLSEDFEEFESEFTTIAKSLRILN